jgi:hypothetical protein
MLRKIKFPRFILNENWHFEQAICENILYVLDGTF